MSNGIRVVAAVFVDGGRVLACRRAAGRPGGGKWEFPGGKVEAGEDPKAALRREIREELGIAIDVGELLDRSVTTIENRRIDLSCYHVEETDGAPIASTDHDLLEWFARSELAALDWAEPDLPAVRLLSADVDGQD
ncbi:(deoxy)nucleoside triphosphate pyrophosphohydrolase [Stackebrandtia soli]|uniref:(deoxy)nucleoside triphosphate pyrophosphohydrolase n=1 Tax=Stackebrandtia soli TaxID=1892856 RepID=UPI0039E9B560